MAGRKAKTGGKARGGQEKAKAHSPEHAADLEARRKAKAAEREAKKAGWSQDKAKAEAEMKAEALRKAREEDKTGRPTIYTRELADAILESIAHEGMTAREACKKHGLVYATFSSWIADNRDGLCERWMRIKRLRVFEMLDEAIRIADDASRDIQTDDEGREFVNRENIQRSKLRVEVRQWTMQRLVREHFGDKVAITGGGPEDAPVKFAPDLASMSDDDLKALARLHSAMAGAT